MAIPYGAATLNAADAYRQFAAASFGMPTALAYGGQQMQMGQQAGGLALQQFQGGAGGMQMASQNAAAVAHRSQASHAASSSQYAAAAAAAAAAQHYAFAGASGAASGMGMWPPAVAPAHFHQQSTTPGLNI